MVQRQVGNLRGAFGVQFSNRDFKAVGAEAFVGPNVTKNRALFAFEKIGAGPVDFEIGARYENQDNNIDDPALPSRSFNGLSESGGAVWNLPKDYALAVTLSHSTRLPTAEELYANGPHLATFQFQVGDPTLNEETASGAELSFRRTRGVFSGNVTVFEQKFHDYVFLSPTGNFVDVDGELVPEFVFDHTEANFRGAEAHIDVDLFHREPHHLQLELIGDALRAEDRDSGEPLPFMPPLRYGLGLRYQGAHFWGRVEGRHANRQDRVATFETPTDSYTLLNASVGYRYYLARSVHDVLLRGSNLSDELARNSVSFLKDIMPLPGRDLSLSYRVSF
jgi:iron complex outermembrane receptor protein